MREAVAAKKPACLERLKKFYRDHRTGDATADLSMYISFALSVDGPPSFKPRFTPAQMPPDTVALQGLQELMVEFYEQAGMGDLWRAAQPAFDEVIARYHEATLQAIQDSNLYLRFPTSGAGGRRFQIYLDLLGAPNQVHTRSFADDYFVVVTPSQQLRVRDIRHAYLHYLLDPLAIRNVALLEGKKDVLDLAGASPLLNEAYKSDPALLTGMCMVKAVEARLDRAQGPAHVEQAVKEGFVLTAHFYEQLDVYEKQEQSFRLYCPEIIKSIDPVKEDKRLAQVQFSSERAVRKVRPAPPPPPALSPAGKAIEEAEALYRDKRFDDAGAGFRKVLEAQATKPERAKAYYGLARIALQKRDPGLAEQLFQQLLESDPEPFEKAWGHVYLARLAMATRDPDLEAARRQYQAALAVEGASEGARRAAETELAQLNSRQ